MLLLFLPPLDFLQLFQLLGGRRRLEAVFPFLIRHAINRLQSIRIGEFVHAQFLGSRMVPFGQAIAAEIGDDHELDVLHLGMRAEMIHQPAEYRGLEFGTLGFVHIRINKMQVEILHSVVPTDPVIILE